MPIGATSLPKCLQTRSPRAHVPHVVVLVFAWCTSSAINCSPCPYLLGEKAHRVRPVRVMRGHAKLGGFRGASMVESMAVKPALL